MTGNTTKRITVPAAAAVLVDPVGQVEIADRLGVQLNTVHVWQTRRGNLTQAAGMPEPDTTASGTPLWNWATIEKWARETGRLAEKGTA